MTTSLPLIPAVPLALPAPRPPAADPRDWPGDGDGPDPYGGIALPARLVRLSALLAGRGYDDAARGAILREAGRDWTVSCSRLVREEDRVDAERQLPCDPRWWRAGWDSIRAEIGAGAEF